MTLKPLKRCSRAGCPTYTREGRCPKHAKEKTTTDANRPNSYRRGYDKRWAKVRLAFLTANPLCEDCIAKSRTTAAEEAHHITKVRDDASKRLDTSNLMALCKACHTRRTARGE